MNKNLPAKKLAQPKANDLYEDEPAAPELTEPPFVPFSSYLTPNNLRLLQRRAYWERSSVQSVLNALVEPLGQNFEMSEPMPSPLEEKLTAKIVAFAKKLLKPKKP